MSPRKTIITELCLVALYFATLAAIHWLQPIRDRAAYLEGFYGMDHNIAFQLALTEGHSACARLTR